MSDFSEDLLRPGTEDDPGGRNVGAGSGMRFPWLQKLVESVGKSNYTQPFCLPCKR